jgi:hypothetical protein
MPITNEQVRDEFKDAQRQAATGGSQTGGGPNASDEDAAGGSSGEGGYGQGQNQAFRQGQAVGPDEIGDLRTSSGLSRGERFDQEQGGGRGDDQVDMMDDLAADQNAHQDQGQGYIATEGECDTGAGGG